MNQPGESRTSYREAAVVRSLAQILTSVYPQSLHRKTRFFLSGKSAKGLTVEDNMLERPGDLRREVWPIIFSELGYLDCKEWVLMKTDRIINGMHDSRSFSTKNSINVTCEYLSKLDKMSSIYIGTMSLLSAFAPRDQTYPLAEVAKSFKDIQVG